MKFTFESENKAEHLISIIENFHLLLKISPPQIEYNIIDESKGLIEQVMFIKSIKKKIRFQVIHKKISEDSFLLKVISGPLKNTETKIEILEKNSKTRINVNLNLKMSFAYKIFSSILSKKIQTVNMTLFNRLEKFANLLHNQKYKISFERNYEVLIIQMEDKKIFFEGWWLGDIESSFIGNLYKKIPCKDKTVIDIGANIGDTAISFIYHGAKRVIGLEPFPINYQFFKSNILKNNMEKQIEIIQGGCSSESSEIFVDPNLSGLSYKMKNSETGQKINQYSLDELINKFNVNNGIIKMNCEGCEYDTILNTSNDTLKKISYFFVAYHNGPNLLKNKLDNAGFNVITEQFSEQKGYIIAQNKN